MSEAVNDARTFARNAKGVRELLSMKLIRSHSKVNGTMLSVLLKAAGYG